MWSAASSTSGADGSRRIVNGQKLRRGRVRDRDQQRTSAAPEMVATLCAYASSHHLSRHISLPWAPTCAAQIEWFAG